MAYTAPANPNPNATKVYALWSNGCYYPGTVARKADNDSWMILFDDGDSCEVPLQNIRRGGVRVGDTVSVSVDEVKVERVDSDGTITVKQVAKPLAFPILETCIEAEWGDRCIDDPSIIVCLETPF